MGKTELLPVSNCRKSIISDLEYFEVCHFQELLRLFLDGKFKCGKNNCREFDF